MNIQFNDIQKSKLRSEYEDLLKNAFSGQYRIEDVTENILEPLNDADISDEDYEKIEGEVETYVNTLQVITVDPETYEKIKHLL